VRNVELKQLRSMLLQRLRQSVWSNNLSRGNNVWQTLLTS